MSSQPTSTNETHKEKLVRLLKDAAAKSIAEGDPWLKHNMERIPAERVIRHMYDPEKETWYTDETIVKIEKTPFTNGAMRHCFRMKKRSPPPQSASNHRFHRMGWNTASNYVAKAYLNEDGEIDTTDQGKMNVMNDILLQYEAQRWAEKFNVHDPPKKIIFIRAYAVEFPDRPGSPWFAVERFISGFDSYGVGFQKHNTNSGFVDEELHRYTPQCFSAHSFYQSKGTRLVADIQGVGDLFTDPQVLSSDYRFGDGDLGTRGMALFFHSFRHKANLLADALGIPEFPLSDHELKNQAKYEEDIFSMSGDSVSGDGSAVFNEMCRFAMMDLNRSKRESALSIPPRNILPLERRDTEKRSNMSTRESIRMSMSISKSSLNLSKATLKRTRSEVDEVRQCLELAKEDFHFTMKQFHRKESGELKAKMKRPELKRRPSLLIRRVSEPIDICDETKVNLGRVHYQLAVLHGMNRFPDIVPDDEDAPHDAFSVLFHLCHAASLHNVAACLALGRLHAGLGTSVSPLVAALVPINFEDAKYHLKRAVESEDSTAAPRLAAAIILHQIYLDDNRAPSFEEGNEDEDEAPASSLQSIPDSMLIDLLETILQFIQKSKTEQKEADEHKKKARSPSLARRIQVGDKVKANYFLEGTFYPAVVDAVSEDGTLITVMYDDDSSTESLSRENVRLIVPPTATQTNLGGPLSDEDAFGENSDEKMVVDAYQLRSELAELIAKTGDNEKAALLYEEASAEAMEAGKMKTATELSLKAAELSS